MTLEEMVQRGTISRAGADLLIGVARSASSFIVFSLPRNAGKSTLVEAVLAHSQRSRHDFFGSAEEADRLASDSERGYLVVAEMGHRGRPGYLAGDEIVRAFDLAARGYSLATSLHADDLQGALGVLAGNGVTGAAVAAVEYFVKVQPLGDPHDPDTRRVVETIERIEPVGPDLAVTTLYRDGQLVVAPAG